MKDRITGCKKALIAYSGGVDSTLLLRCSVDVLGRENVVAATALSETYPARQLEEASKIATLLGVRHVTFETEELKIHGFRQNPPDRCYHCKKELYQKLIELARNENCDVVFDGSNLDDTADYRPGLKALEELGIRSPLVEAGFTKSMVRDVSKDLGLSTWNKPAFACLSSRFPYGSEITEEALSMVDRAEECLRRLGFRQMRVRHYGDLARIEIGKDELDKMLSSDVREEVTRALKNIGYRYVCLDLEGYRTGSMNEVLPDHGRVRGTDGTSSGL
ncbi:MAG: ATP-dependent sacrificial sulfur transferase LarE [Candidatus Glassbacteria bacterium]